MIVKIDRSPGIQKSLDYNIEKLNSLDDLGKPIAEIIDSSFRIDNTSEFKNILDGSGNLNKNKNLKNRYLHIKVSLSPDDVVTSNTLKNIGRDVLDGLGFSPAKTQYVSFIHHDTDHPHFHVCLSRSSVLGKTNGGDFEKYASVKLSRKLEKKYNLVNAFEQGLDKNRIRIERPYERDKEHEQGRQSDVQQVREVVSKALSSSPSLKEFVNDLSRNNVSIKFRVQQNGKGEESNLIVGMSYSLKSINPELVMKSPSLSLDWNMGDRNYVLKELEQEGYSIDGLDKYYLNSANQVRINSNPYPIQKLNDMAIKASALGPGSSWHSISEKYDISTDIFKEHLVDELLSPSVKKGNVWEFFGDKVFEAEDDNTKILLLGLKENNPGYILEAIKNGVDWEEVWEAKRSQIKGSETEIRFMDYKTKFKSEEDLLAHFPKVKFELDKINSESVIDPSIAKEVAIGLINESVSKRADENIMRYSAGNSGLELELKQNKGVVSGEELGTNLYKYFLESNEEMLNEALKNISVKFLQLRDALNYQTTQTLRISDALLEKIEERVAKEMFPNPFQGAIAKRDLETKIMQGDNDLRFLVNLPNADFGNITDLPNRLLESRIAQNVLARIEQDILLLPSHIKKHQDELEMASAKGDGAIIMDLTRMPMLDFSSVYVGAFKSDYAEDEIQKLRDRIEADIERREELEELRKGRAQVNRSTMEIVKLEIFGEKSNTQDFDDIGLDLDKNKEQNRGESR